MSFIGVRQSMRKMRPGTLGGQSRSVSPVVIRRRQAPRVAGCLKPLGPIDVGDLLHGAISGDTLYLTPDSFDTDAVYGYSWPGLDSTQGLITFCNGTNIEDMTVDDVPGHAGPYADNRIFMVAAQFAADEQIQKYEPSTDTLSTLATIAGAQNIVYHPDNGLLYVDSSDGGGTLYTVDPDTGTTVNLGTYSPGIFARTIAAVPGGLWGWTGGQTFVFFTLAGSASAYTVTGTIGLSLPVPRPNGDAWFMRRESTGAPWLGWSITQGLVASRLPCLDGFGHSWSVVYQSPDATRIGVEVDDAQWGSI